MQRTGERRGRWEEEDERRMGGGRGGEGGGWEEVVIDVFCRGWTHVYTSD